MLNFFKEGFRASGVYYVFFKGILNFHLLFDSIESNFPSLEEIRNRTDPATGAKLFQDTKWSNFVSLAIFNENPIEIKEILKKMNIQKYSKFAECEIGSAFFI